MESAVIATRNSSLCEALINILFIMMKKPSTLGAIKPSQLSRVCGIGFSCDWFETVSSVKPVCVYRDRYAALFLPNSFYEKIHYFSRLKKSLIVIYNQRLEYYSQADTNRICIDSQ